MGANDRQADFLRYGSAKGIMSMSAENSTALWDAVKDSSLPPWFPSSSTSPTLFPLFLLHAYGQ